jgi:hypothetical protein
MGAQRTITRTDRTLHPRVGTKGAPPSVSRGRRTGSGATWAVTPAKRAPLLSRRSTARTSGTWRRRGSGGATTSAANRDYFSRSTPIYVDGMLYTLAGGTRRQVAAIDPATGETLWTFREPETIRFCARPGRHTGKASPTARSMAGASSTSPRPASSSGRSTRRLDGRSRTGASRCPLDGFARTGVVDLLPDLLADWGPWQDYLAGGGAYDPDYGIPRELGMITSVGPADRRERRRRRPQLPPAGLRADAGRERPGRHHGIRRGDRRVPLEVPRDPSAGRVRPRDVGERRLVLVG